MKINNLSWDWDCGIATINKKEVEAHESNRIYTFDVDAYQMGVSSYGSHTSPSEYSLKYIDIDINNFIAHDEDYNVLDITESEIEDKIQEIKELIKTI